MKSIILILVFVHSFSASADGYYGRFWRGEAKTSYPKLRKYCDDRKTDCFVDLINKWLIPATASYAAKKALMAYAPVLMPDHLRKKYHDEIALILYTSEKNYKELRNNKKNREGSSYGPIHGDIFATKLSRSLVPIKYDGVINLNEAQNESSYDLKGTKEDLINASGKFFLYENNLKRKALFQTSMEIYLNELKKDKKILAAYALVTNEYLMLYLFSKSPTYFDEFGYAPKALWSTKLKNLKPISKSPLLYEALKYGEGANLFFTPGTKPGMVDHYRLKK